MDEPGSVTNTVRSLLVFFLSTNKDDILIATNDINIACGSRLLVFFFFIILRMGDRRKGGGNAGNAEKGKGAPAAANIGLVFPLLLHSLFRII